MEAVLDERICVKCGNGESTGQLDQVGALWKEDSGKQHPLNTLIYYAERSKLTPLVDALNSNKENQNPTFIHNGCRTELRNLSRRKRPHDESSNRRKSARLENEVFDFKKQCFYCDKLCVLDVKHPNRNKFEYVRTKDTGIYKKTLEICKIRNDETSQKISKQLLSVNDLVAAEARYHISCRLKFEKSPTNLPTGRPIEGMKHGNFEKACIVMENDMELYTVNEFHKLMLEIANENDSDVYSLRMVQSKLTQKYGSSLTLITRQGKSNIIMLDRVSSILSEEWYKQKKDSQQDESERIVKTAAQLIRNAMKQFEHDTDSYPTADDVKCSESKFVPQLLNVFIQELVKSPKKQISMAQILFSAAHPRTIMPLNFGLAVSVDNCLSSKWMIDVLSKLGLSVSYDEVKIVIKNILFKIHLFKSTFIRQ